MVKKHYDWAAGQALDDHSKRKLKVLKEYFREYLITRCQIPHQSKFRLAVVDGFAGAGKYGCGNDGSPLIFLNVLKDTTQEINTIRASDGRRPVEIECYLVFNDSAQEAVRQLKENIAPFIAEIKETQSKLHVKTVVHNKKFDKVYPEVKKTLLSAKYRNVLFNLDQYGYADVNLNTVRDILTTWKAAEVFLTFSIQAALTYLSPDRTKNHLFEPYPELLEELYRHIEGENGLISKEKRLGGAERIIFNNFKSYAPFVSPFAINNPKGWRYWLMHFANSQRAREVYNDILHSNSKSQVHFGRAGLNMLSYDPKHEGQLYLFGQDSREADKKNLHDDIPRFIDEHGDAITVESFKAGIYNETAAHSDDINKVMIESDDVEVITEAGGERRKSNTIRNSDILRPKMQRSLFLMFFDKDK